MSKSVYVIAAVRTPMGSFLGKLSSVAATDLGAAAIRGALSKSGVSANQVDEVFMGNVLQAGLGQAPARQAAMAAGIPNDVPCTTINKVCASGMKSIALAAQAVANGDIQVAIAGGMENMSRVPHYFNVRSGTKFGDVKMKDGMLLDGLTDVYNSTHMGNCAELCAKEHNISREEQDNFAIESYNRSARAWAEGAFQDEVIPVVIPQRKGDPITVDTDEEFSQVKMEKVRSLRPAFQKDGTITAANASTLNDGASALILASEEAVKANEWTPIARIVSTADAAHDPEWFTTAPAKAIPRALNKAGWQSDDVDLWELNEAFSVVGLINIELMGLDAERVNVNGGAVSLGHPLGSSGSRIVVTLIHALRVRNLKKGGAGICNGGGGASALMIEAL
ncbi:MAG TPA: acetyl-CoA C-acetyltransferase [Flavobacteriales bacterium]|nr:acetyl-CoA C-acetyltransferase [Flavobacteriales bacterium]